MSTIIQTLPYLVLPIILAIPLGLYMSSLVDGERNFMSRAIKPIENKLYKWLKIEQEEMEKIFGICTRSIDGKLFISFFNIKISKFITHEFKSFCWYELVFSIQYSNFFCN